MQTRRRRKQTAAPSILQLPDSYLHQLIYHISPESKLSLRATCKAFLHVVDGATFPAVEVTATSSQPSEPCSCANQLQEAPKGLKLHVATRKPSFSVLHSVQLLHNVVVLDTQAALRGAICIGCPDPAQQLANSLPRLELALLNNSQASLVELLVHAAPQLSSVQLSVTSSAPKVISQLSQFSRLASLEVTLTHPAWMKGCADLGGLKQLQRLVITGKPLDEASKHGIGSISSWFWEQNIACLTGLTALSVNPWIKAVEDAGAVTYSSLTNLRQLHVPYCSGKLGPGAVSTMLAQLASCSQLTSLSIGVHEFNWDVNNLSQLTQLRELEIHNPFLKEVWGLQPLTAAALAPLTAATGLTSLTLSHLKLPLLENTMATAGQAVAAVAAQPGAAPALADALASGDGPAADIVHAIAAAAVATVLRNAAANANAAGAIQSESIRAVWNAVADTLQQQAASAVAAAAQQLPAAYGARAAAAAAATAAGSPAALQSMHLVGSTGAAAADVSGQAAAAAAVASGSSTGSGGVVPPEMLALAHEVIAAMAKHTAVRLQQQRQQQVEQQQEQQRSSSTVDEAVKQQYLRAAHALAASVGPVVAAAAAAGAALPGGQLPAYMAVPPPPAQALAAAHLAAQVAGGNPLAAAAALAGPPLGFVAVPAVPPPLLPPPPPLGQAAAGAAVPAVGIPAALPAPGLAAVSAAAADAAAVAAASAAKASASMLFEQVPVLASLKRLTVGTTHGRLSSGVQIAAFAPGLTCLEDLSELPRIPPLASDVLGGLQQLQLLTVNVDTLQLYARHASLTGLRGLQGISSSDACSTAGAGGAGGSDKVGSNADMQQRTVVDEAAAAAAEASVAVDASGSKPSKKGSSKAAAAAGAAAGKGSKKKAGSRGSRSAPKATAAAAAAVEAEPLALDIAAAAATPATAAAAEGPDTQASASAPVAADALAAAEGKPPVCQDGNSSSNSSSCGRAGEPDMLHLGSSWRQLSNIRCLRLLMMGHLQTPDAFSEVRILPTVPGVTRLELCSAFGGSLEYADTYTIEEDPYLWQEQVNVQELILDGGVLLGGFMVNADMAKLLKQKLTRLQKLVLCRCLDLTIEHLETAVKKGLAPLIVVKRDCVQVSEADVVRLNESVGAAAGVVVELESVGAADYVGKSFTYAVDE